MPKVKKQKQKQKQKQSQRVVVNINQRAPARRRATPARRSGGGGGGGAYPVYTPVYMNAPSDLSPIVYNLPAQYQNQPAITMPTNTAPQPSLQALTYPTPTALQAPTEDVRPLGGAVKPITRATTPPRKAPPMGSLAEQILAEHAKRAKKKETPIPAKLPAIIEVKQQSPLIAEIQQKLGSPNKGLRQSPMPKAFEPPTTQSPFQSALQGAIASREVRQSPSGIIRPIPVRGRPVQFTDEEREAKKIYNATQEGKREMAERSLFAKEDPLSKRSMFFR